VQDGNARLRALAFALGAERSGAGGGVEIDDSDLLAYMLDSLPRDRRLQLEGTARGDVGLLGRLVTLYAALNSPTDERDQVRADDPARKIPRHRLGRIDICSRGEVLQFKPAQALPRRTPSPQQSTFEFKRSTEVFSAPDPIPYRERPRLRWSPKAAAMLGAVLKVTMNELHSSMHLMEGAQSLLARWEASNLSGEFDRRGTDISERDNEEQVGEQLLESLRELERVADHIRAELGRIPLRIAGEPRSDAQVALLREDALAASFELRGLRPPLDSKGWMDDADMRAGHWVLHLTGSARPAPQLAITLREHDKATSPAEPFLTLVRPGQDFQVFKLDSSRSGKVALPIGESVMLVQDDKVWEIPLSFHNR